MYYEEAHALFSYNPDTGVITNRVSRGKARAGEEAGTVRPDGYRQVKVGKKIMLSHRLAWLLTNGAVSESLDHVDGVRDNNVLSNLREADYVVNGRNMKSRSGRAAGVTRHRGKTWMARMHGLYLGEFTDYFEAVCARKSAEIKHGYTGRIT